MKEFATRASVGAVGISQLAFNRFRNLVHNERGGTAENLVIIGILVLAAVAVFSTLILPALKTQGGNISNCIKSVNTGKCTSFK